MDIEISANQKKDSISAPRVFQAGWSRKWGSITETAWRIVLHSRPGAIVGSTNAAHSARLRDMINVTGTHAFSESGQMPKCRGGPSITATGSGNTVGKLPSDDDVIFETITNYWGKPRLKYDIMKSYRIIWDSKWHCEKTCVLPECSSRKLLSFKSTSRSGHRGGKPVSRIWCRCKM